jgi:large subunit ribosomal protein L22
MKAQITNYRQSPRKVRLVADMIRGKDTSRAKDELLHSTKRAAGIFVKLIDSALANAKNNFKVENEDLIVSDVRVDQGITLKRIRPRSKGMAHRINKRTSNIVVKLAESKTKQQADTILREKKATPAKKEEKKDK